MEAVKTERALKVSIVALLALFTVVVYNAIHQPVIVKGDSAPDFTVTADNGQTVSVANFGGKLLVLNFWASWCPPCVQETPSLDRFARNFRDQGVVVLAISVDKDERAYRQFLQRFKPGFLTARDAGRGFNAKYGTFIYPESYIISKDGKVLEKYAEGINWDDPALVNHLRSLI